MQRIKITAGLQGTELQDFRTEDGMDVLKKIPARAQDPQVRAANFEEVSLGYNKEEAME